MIPRHHFMIIAAEALFGILCIIYNKTKGFSNFVILLSVCQYAIFILFNNIKIFFHLKIIIKIY